MTAQASQGLVKGPAGSVITHLLYVASLDP